MNLNGNYDSIGVSMVEELYKQAEEIYPITDEPTPQSMSLFKRIVAWVKRETPSIPSTLATEPCGDEMAQPCL